MKTQAKFKSDNVVCTRGVHHSLVTFEEMDKFIYDCLNRHFAGDWGDTPDDDKKMNEEALNSGNDRIFSSYNIPENIDADSIKIWIITEYDKYDKSVTTVLFPSEY